MSFVKHIFDKEAFDQIGIADIKKLIENRVEEFLHLDYERIPAEVQYDGLAKHISGFLNTAGGIVVFGVSERKQRIPDKITWTTIKKETLENNLYQKIDPWYEGIQINPVQNPNKDTQRIFVILVPRSKHPPHMANYTYHTRLNFQTRPIGHEQVSRIFRQHYLQNYDLINLVYGPIYNELASYYNQRRLRKREIKQYMKVKSERLYLLAQDLDLWLELDALYHKIGIWNKAIEQTPFRLARIINKAAKDFFEQQLYEVYNHSAIKADIKAESIHQIIHIDQAVLNDKDPIDFWKEDYPFARILEAKIQLELIDKTRKRDFTTVEIPKEEFKRFRKKLNKEFKKDELIKFIRKEFEEMRSRIEFFFDELEKRM